MKKFSTLVISIAIPELVGIISGYFTVSSIPTWYRTLTKPFFSPPNWILAPVWTTLYLLMGIAGYLVWDKGAKNKKNRHALTVYYIQLILNFLWSFLFFGLRSPGLAFINIAVLWIMIVITIDKFDNLSKTAAYLLIPYLLWVSFASLLNFSIIILN